MGTTTATVEVAPGETITNPSQCHVRVALYEDNCTGATEPHTGNTVWGYIGRLMISDVLLTISNSGEQQQVVGNFAIPTQWKIPDLHAVAFVQRDDASKAVLQAGFSPVQYSVTLADLDGSVERVDTPPMDFDSQVIYTGTVDDDVDLTIDKSQLPVGWDAEIVWNSTSYPTSLTIPDMTMNQTEDIAVRVIPSAPGVGEVGLTVAPASLPGAAINRTYITFYQRPKLLFVDDDQGAAGDVNFQNAIQGAGYFALKHDLLADGGPGATWMANFDAVIWNTGELATLTLTTANMTEIMAFLDGGGKFFLVSQGFLNDRGLHPIMTNYFHVNGRTLDVGAPSVVGVAADPIGDGMSFNISPPFPDKADAVTSTNGGVGWLDAGVNDVAMHYDSGVFKTVFLAAPFEGIASPNDALVMQRVIEWLVPAGATGVSPMDVAGASGLALYPNVPNPFGDATSVRFALPQAGPVSLTVYDVAGRRVASLVDRRLEAGTHSVMWDGRDASGSRVASGVYLLRLHAAGEAVSREVVRVR
jgi:hypothetical protein